MGAIFEVYDSELDRKAALKILLPKYNDNEMMVERFIREGKSIARINNPNIVSIFAVGKYEEYHSIIMEYVDGVPLSEILEEYIIPVERALNIARQMMVGLSAIHSEQIIHRDIKPGNTMLLSGDRIKIVDFGIAKQLDESTTQRLTETGQFFGTYLYTAPEIVKGIPQNTQSDIFAVGAILYEMLVGAPLIKGSSVGEVLQFLNELEVQFQEEDQPFIPLEVQDLVKGLCARSLEERYKTAEDAIIAIDEVVSRLGLSLERGQRAQKPIYRLTNKKQLVDKLSSKGFTKTTIKRIFAEAQVYQEQFEANSIKVDDATVALGSDLEESNGRVDAVTGEKHIQLSVVAVNKALREIHQAKQEFAVTQWNNQRRELRRRYLFGALKYGGPVALVAAAIWFSPLKDKINGLVNPPQEVVSEGLPKAGEPSEVGPEENESEKAQAEDSKPKKAQGNPENIPVTDVADKKEPQPENSSRKDEVALVAKAVEEPIAKEQPPTNLLANLTPSLLKKSVEATLRWKASRGPSSSSQYPLNPPEISWAKVNIARGYRVEFSKDRYFQNKIFSARLKRTNFVWKEAVPGQFFVRIQALGKGDSKSEYSPTMELNLRAEAPKLKPRYSLAKEYSSETDMEKGESISIDLPRLPYKGEYQLEMSKDKQFSSAIWSESAKGTKIKIPLEKAGRYFLRASVIDGEGRSISSYSRPSQINLSQNLKLPIPKIVLPTDGTIYPISSRKKSVPVVLMWERLDKVEAYEVEVGSDRDFRTVVVNQSTASNKFVFRGKNLKGTLYWRVRAKQKSFKSDWTSSQSFKLQLK